MVEARRIFRDAGIPTYDTPEQAVRGFLQVVDYQGNQNLLMETPPSLQLETPPDTDAVLELVAPESSVTVEIADAASFGAPPPRLTPPELVLSRSART